MSSLDSGWGIAASIDPVTVLPYMQWCMQAWAAPYVDPPSTYPTMKINFSVYVGNWIPQSAFEWFGLDIRAIRSG
ncbi:hypothetical protein [Mycobacterium sp.]|uniref:hypothetical protein n=1 Tax=Mycobacterium sp. TaxID=1785 RepID=UPI003F94C8D4